MNNKSSRSFKKVRKQALLNLRTTGDFEDKSDTTFFHSGHLSVHRQFYLVKVVFISLNSHQKNKVRISKGINYVTNQLMVRTALLKIYV